MSSIDERVVKMEFDNAKFESGVKNSLNTIENLTVSLNKLDKTQVSFDQIQRAAQNFSVDNILTGVEKVQDRLSTFGIIGGTAIAKVTNTAMDFIGSSLTKLTSGITSAWNTINSGGMQRAKNIEQAKFQIEGIGRTWEEVSDSIDKAVSDTAYGLDEAALAASQFLATGIETGDKMTVALRSISGVAAMTNSGYSEIANIMTTIAGNGKVMTMQLNQLSAKGINAAATIRDYFNSSEEHLAEFTKLYNATKKKNQQSLASGVKATEQDIRTMVTNGAIDFAIFSQAMDQAYGEHAKDAQRTFEGASSNVSAALKRLGADFKTVTISSEDYDKTLDSKKKADFTKTTFNQINVLNELRNVIKGLQTELRSAGFVELFTDIYHAVSRGTSFFLNSLYVTDDAGTHLIPQLSEALVNFKGAFENVAGFVVGIAHSFSSAWKSVFPDSLADTILNISSRVKDFTDMLPKVDDITGAISDIFGLNADDTSESLSNLEESYNGVTGSLRELVAQTINGDFGNGAERIDKLGDSYQQIQDAVNSCYDDQWRLHEDWINNIDETIMVGANLAKTEEDIAEKQQESADIAEKSEEAYNGMMTTLENTIPVVKKYSGSFEGLKGILMGFFSILNIVKGAIVTAILIIRKFVFPVIFRIGEVLIEIIGTIGSFIAALNSLLPTTRQAGEALDIVANVLRPLWDLFHWVTQGIIDFMRAIRPENDPLGHLQEYIATFIDSVSDLGSNMGSVLEKVQNFATGLVEKIGGIELPNGSKISDIFYTVFSPVVGIMAYVADKIRNLKLPDGSTIQSKLNKVFSGIPGYFSKLTNKIQNKASGLFSFFETLKERTADAIRMDGISIPTRINYVFEPVLDLFTKLKDKLSHVFAPLLDFLSPITTSMGKLTGKVVDGLKLLVSSIGNKISNIPDVAASLRKKFEPIIEFLKPFAIMVRNALGDIVSGIGSFVGDIADSIDLSKNPFEIIINILSTFGNKIKTALDKIANSKILSGIKNFAVTVIGGLSSGVQSIIAGIQRVFSPIFEALQNVFGQKFAFADGSANGITEEASEFGSNLDAADKSISGPGMGLVDTLRELATKIGLLLPIAANSILMALSIWNVGVKLPREAANMFKAASGIFNSMTKLFKTASDSLKKFTRAVDFTLYAEGIKAIAVSLAIFAGAIIVLGNVPWEVIQQGLIGLSLLAVMIVGIVSLLAVISSISGLEKAGQGLLTIAGSLFLFVVAIGAIMFLLGAKTEEVNGVTVTTYKNLDKMLVAIGMIFLVILAMMIPISAAAVIVKKLGGSFKDLGNSFLGIGVGLLVMVFAIEKIKGMIEDAIASDTVGTLIGAVVSLFAIAAVMILLLSALDGIDTDTAKLGLGFALMSAGLLIIAFAIKQLADVPLEQLITGFIGIAVILGILAGLLYIIGNQGLDMEAIGSSILKIGAAIGILVLSLSMMATLGESLWPSIDAMAWLVIMLAALALICGNATSSLTSGGLGMLLMASAILVLAVAIFFLQDAINGNNLGSVIVVLAAITLGLTLLAGVCALAKQNMTKGAGAILIIAASLSALLLALKYFMQNADPVTMIAAAGAILIIVIAIAALAAAAEFLAVGFEALTGLFIAIAAVVIALAAAVLLGAIAFDILLNAIVMISESGVDLPGMALGLVALGASLIVLAAGAAILGIAMIVLGAGALVAAVGVGLFAVAILALIVVIFVAVSLFQMAGAAIMDGLVGGIINGIGSVIGAIGNVASGIINGFCSILGIHSPSDVFEKLGKFITEGLKGGLDGGADIGKMFGDSVGNGALDGLTSQFGNFDLQGLMDGKIEGLDLGALNNLGGDWAGNLGSGVSSSTQPVEASEEKVKEAAAKASEKTDLFTPVGALAMEKFSQGMLDFDANAFYKGLLGKEALPMKMEEAINKIQFDSEAFRQAGITCMEGFLKGVNESTDKIKTAIGYIVVAASSSITIPDLKEVGANMGTTFCEGLSSKIEDALIEGTNLALEAKSGAETVSMYTTGEQLGQGFINGLRSKIVLDQVKSAGISLANTVKVSTEKEGEIKSPSKVMFGVGGYFGEGFALGIKSKTSRVASISSAVAETAINIASDMMDMLDADPNLEPTITPVLDMSNVDSGLRAMSSDPIFGIGDTSSYFGIADMANKATESMTSNSVVNNIQIEVNWEAGDDANAVAEKLVYALDAKLKLEG